ncbi:hypothetical protein [Kribbella italica]|uniref:Flagellar biosynthesis chaperone FliJ n=1 Tax=Kribbella italica TaxID=1540520 RepID=A0A7W9J3M8_9ACTN|nr:hypothetical protein [Kribbella italica]MBB5834770.1 flagellar biosynthesis chaperone FliJ [Kribbella italica]
MSQVQQLQMQLHQIANEAKQAAGGLAGFKQRFTQHSTQVEALIAGTATGVDRDIAQILDAASKAVDQAVESLHIASNGCTSYANQL